MFFGFSKKQIPVCAVFRVAGQTDGDVVGEEEVEAMVVAVVEVLLCV